MSKKTLGGIILGILGLILLAGSTRLLPDIKPLCASLALIVFSVALIYVGSSNKKWNRRMVLGMIFVVFGLVAIGATWSRLPDFKPVVSMAVLTLLGVYLFLVGSGKEKTNLSAPVKFNSWNAFNKICAILLLIIPAVLLPQINWHHPKDPLGVAILCFLSAVALIFAWQKNHPAKKEITIAGGIAILNFLLIRIYESGAFNFLAKFYRLFEPFYASFDKYAESVEYVLIGFCVLMVIIFTAKKIRVKELGKKTLHYLWLEPILAIFLFEMLGLPAGFLAGATTRSDLLVTDVNAVMSTFGMVFIGVFAFILFKLFPFWVAPVVSGLWWIFWKPWLLHHPDPALFTSLEAFLPAALFLFFTGLKRVTLPMILVVLLSKKKK